MSGVGSTNAMKKGSANNPFLAYSEADMQGFLNSAYTGCIVKYTGSSTKKGIQDVLPLDSAKSLGDAQNLVANLYWAINNDSDYGEVAHPAGGTIRENPWHITVVNKTTGKTQYIQEVKVDTTNKKFVDTSKTGDLAWLLSDWYLSSLNDSLSFQDSLTKNVTVLECEKDKSKSGYDLLTYWPLEKGWQKSCFNTEGKILLWGYGDTVELSCPVVYYYNRGPFWVEPYVVNELYKVAYGNGQYYFEEYYHINDDVTTATVEDVASGKTFYDFTGTKQTGTGTKINPYIATDLDTFKSFPVGSFIKWLGPNKTVLDETTGQMLIQNEIYRAVEDGDILQYVILPTLSNPGTAADLAQGKQLIDGEGKVVEGEAAFSFGDYSVKVIDYDGTVLMEKKGNTGDVIDLPTAPTHDKLVFQEWSASVAVSDNKVTIDDNDVIVGAVYTTVSGQNEFDITLTKATGLTIALYMDGTKDWGDGTSDTATSHTYTAYGDYTIKCNGTQMTTSGSGLFGQSSRSNNYYCTAVRFATVTSIDTYAFTYCYSLTNIVISNSVTSIIGYTFYCCASLISIVIPNSVTSIGTYSFYNCYSLTSIVIPNSVTIIQSRVVSGCSSLTSIVIPNSATSIGGYAFCECSSLTKIIIPNGVTSIGTYVCNGCYSLTSIVIPNSVTSIGNEAFASIRALKSIVIPSGMTSIKDSTFSGCASLTSIVIPNSVTKIGGMAFYNCYSLTSIVIPNSVTSIGDNAFGNCYSLTKYDFSQYTIVPKLSGRTTFSGINGLCKIIVPDSLYDEWIAATNWSTYADYIYKASEEVTQ